jgi:uncharacterized protein (DUF885 family)
LTNAMQSDDRPDADLAAIAERYWEFRTREFPLATAAAGDDRHPNQLERESLHDYERRHSEFGGYLQAAKTIAADALGPEARITRDVLIRELELERRGYDLGLYLEPALLFPFGTPSALLLVPQSLAVNGEQGFRDYVTRIGAVPRVLEEVIERMRAGVRQGRLLPRVLRPRLMEAVQKFSHPDAPIVEHWMKPLRAAKDSVTDTVRNASEEDVRRCVRESLAPAYQRFLDFVQNDLTTRDSVSIGASPAGGELYQHLIGVNLGPGHDAQSLHEWGCDEVARIEDEMRAQQRALGDTGDLRTFLAQRAQRPEARARSAEDLITRISVLSKRIDALIPRLFGRIPRQTYGIELIPEAAAAGLPPAYADPAPAGSRRAGIHWVNPLPERCTLDMLVPLALHEAWPGHLMHLALLTELEHLPAFRRFGALSATAYIEGWALYCERLGLELDLYQSPDDHLGRLRMEIWRAARLVVDTGLHALGWSRQQAIDYMRAHTGLPGETIESEVDRYIGMPAQALVYKVGERKILELRARGERTLAAKFELRAFHDRLIDCGAVSLDRLDQHVSEWIAAQKAAA